MSPVLWVLLRAEDSVGSKRDAILVKGEASSLVGGAYSEDQAQIVEGGHRVPGREKESQRREHWNLKSQGILDLSSVVIAASRGRPLMETKKLYQKHLKGKVSMNWEKVSNRSFTEKAHLWPTVFVSLTILSFIASIVDSHGFPIYTDRCHC